MDHSRKMLRFRDMLLFLNPPTQHEALLRARSAALVMNIYSVKTSEKLDKNTVFAFFPVKI